MRSVTTNEMAGADAAPDGPSLDRVVAHTIAGLPHFRVDASDSPSSLSGDHQGLVANQFDTFRPSPNPDGEPIRGSIAPPERECFDPYKRAGEAAGDIIGPYVLLRVLGQGGMGTVFMAEQDRPIRRKVALKVIKAGMDTRQVVARFEAEHQALALMDHPNIARVLDAGATSAGRPFFVMELVRGVPITEYCDRNHLTIRERLELFLSVCRAIHHAHQKGIIHRDIKPNNVLVALHDGAPEPKVIDFGVAKATQQRLTEHTMFTECGAVLGTLEYMSPEQAEVGALDIDTRSDIYSLGVLLYELLTGSTPLDTDRCGRSGYWESIRRIRDEEPVKPSARLCQTSGDLAAIAVRRHAGPAHLARQVRGDLDWIAMKALEKDRTRRYETANGLAHDIQRHLDGDPVQAGPPSARYKLGKFALKHRGALAKGVTVVMLLGAATVLSAAMAHLAHVEYVRASWAEQHEKAMARRSTEASKHIVELRDRVQASSELRAFPSLIPLRGELLGKLTTCQEEIAALRAR